MNVYQYNKDPPGGNCGGRSSGKKHADPLFTGSHNPTMCPTAASPVVSYIPSTFSFMPLVLEFSTLSCLTSLLQTACDYQHLKHTEGDKNDYLNPKGIICIKPP